MKVTILGCGPSTGVPAVGGYWGVCDPDEPRNRRLRSSILVEHEDTILLVDTTPDCRAQLLAAGVGMRPNTFLQNITRARKLLKECLRLAGVDLAVELR